MKPFYEAKQGYFEVTLTDYPALSDTLRTDGGCQIYTKLGQGGQ